MSFSYLRIAAQRPGVSRRHPPDRLSLEMMLNSGKIGGRLHPVLGPASLSKSPSLRPLSYGPSKGAVLICALISYRLYIKPDEFLRPIARRTLSMIPLR